MNTKNLILANPINMVEPLEVQLKEQLRIIPGGLTEMGSSPPPGDPPNKMSKAPAVVIQFSESPYMDVAQAAAYTHLSIKTLYNLKSLGKLKGHNAGGTKKGKVLFLKTDLDKFIKGEKE